MIAVPSVGSRGRRVRVAANLLHAQLPLPTLCFVCARMRFSEDLNLGRLEPQAYEHLLVRDPHPRGVSCEFLYECVRKSVGKQRGLEGVVFVPLHWSFLTTERLGSFHVSGLSVYLGA